MNTKKLWLAFFQMNAEELMWKCGNNRWSLTIARIYNPCDVFTVTDKISAPVKASDEL